MYVPLSYLCGRDEVYFKLQFTVETTAHIPDIPSAYHLKLEERVVTVEEDGTFARLDAKFTTFFINPYPDGSYMSVLRDNGESFLTSR